MFGPSAKKALSVACLTMFLFLLIVGSGLGIGGYIISSSLSCIEYTKLNLQPMTETIWVGNNSQVLAAYPWPAATPIAKDYLETAKKSSKTWIVRKASESANSSVTFDLYYELKDSITVMSHSLTVQPPDSYSLSRIGVKDRKLAITWKPDKYTSSPYLWLAFGIIFVLGSIVGFLFSTISLIREEYPRKIPKQGISNEDIDKLMQKSSKLELP